MNVIKPKWIPYERHVMVCKRLTDIIEWRNIELRDARKDYFSKYIAHYCPCLAHEYIDFDCRNCREQNSFTSCKECGNICSKYHLCPHCPVLECKCGKKYASARHKKETCDNCELLRQERRKRINIHDTPIAEAAAGQPKEVIKKKSKLPFPYRH